MVFEEGNCLLIERQQSQHHLSNDSFLTLLFVAPSQCKFSKTRSVSGLLVLFHLSVSLFLINLYSFILVFNIICGHGFFFKNPFSSTVLLFLLVYSFRSKLKSSIKYYIIFIEIFLTLTFIGFLSYESNTCLMQNCGDYSEIQRNKENPS